MSALGEIFGGDRQKYVLFYDEDLVVYVIRDSSGTSVHSLGSQTDAATARAAMDSWLSSNGGWTRVSYWLHLSTDTDRWYAVYAQVKDGVLEDV